MITRDETARPPRVFVERSGDALDDGGKLTVVGPRLVPGDRAPEFALDLLVPGEWHPRTLSLARSRDTVRVLHVVNSLDTPMCHASTCRWDELRREALPTTVRVYTISMDLPWAQARWRIEHGVVHDVLSAHRSEAFGRDYGVLLKERRLLQRAVFVVDVDDRLVHAEYVADQTRPPDFSGAVAAARRAALV